MWFYWCFSFVFCHAFVIYHRKTYAEREPGGFFSFSASKSEDSRNPEIKAEPHTILHTQIA